MKNKSLSIAFPSWCVFMRIWCVFPLLCVHVSFRYVFVCGVFFGDFHVCPSSFCDLFLCRWHVLSPLCAFPLNVGEIPNVRQPMKMKDKSLSIVFPSWCVFMPFWCVFPLLCVHVSFQYVFACSVFLWISCVLNFFFRRLFVQMTCALASLRFSCFCGRIPKCKKTNENEKQITFNCVSLLVCFHAFLMCFPFVVCSCVFSICVRVWFFSVIFMCVQVRFATSICADDMCSRLFAFFLLTWEKSPKCKTTNENEKQITFNCVSLLVCFHAYLMCFPFVVCSCVFSICVRVWRFFRWFSCVSKFVLRLIFVQMTCALASLRFSS